MNTGISRRLLVGFIAAACAYMLFLEPWGHDTWFHLQRLLDIEQQLGEGRLRAHLAGNAAQGKGLPVWIYYSQWAYWPAIVFRALGTGPLLSLKIVFSVALLICTYGCYRLLRLHAAETAAAFGALLFVSSNYLMGEVFQRAAYAEFLSVALFPLLLYHLHRVLADRSRGSGVAAVLLAALMILFHPLSFMNAGIGVAAYAVFMVTGRGIPWPRLLRLVPLLALALALSAFYWLPAVIETRYVMGEEGVPTRLAETFLGLWNYLNFSSVTNLGFVLTLLFPAVVVSLLLRRRPEGAPGWQQSWPLAAGIALYLLLTLRASAPLYESVPLLASTLWVWRVLFPMILLVVVFVTANLDALPPWARHPVARRAVAAVAILQAAVFVLWNSADELSLRQVGMPEIRQEIAGEMARMEGFGIDEYLPRLRSAPGPGEACVAIVSVPAGDPREMPIGLPGDSREVRIGVPAGDPREMRIFVPEAEPGTCIHLPRLWNVRYEAAIEGHPVPVYVNPRGEILLAPGGRSGELVLRLAQPAWASLANLLSAAAAILLAVGAIGMPGRGRPASDGRRDS